MSAHPAGAQARPLPTTADWAGLLDDAALFPPGDMPLALAVPAHRAHRAGSHDAMVGAFLVPAARLRELLGTLEDHPQDTAPLDVGIIAPIEDLPEALAAVISEPQLALRSVEVGPSTASPAQVIDTLARSLPDEVTAAVEVPRDARRPSFFDALSGTAIRAKLRTGGLSAAAFPAADELADALIACRERGIGCKATAGLHHAVHHTDPETGFVHHGYLNLLLAADAAARDASSAEVAEALTVTDTAAMADAVAAIGPGTARWRAARTVFVSFGTCSIPEPIADLEALGLLGADAPENNR